MEQSNQRSGRPHQVFTTKAPIVDLFNFYLGINSRQKPEDPSKETSYKIQKRVTAPIRELPPPNKQFIFDFQKLQVQFQDQDQFRALTESVLISFIIQCNSHGPQSEFILFALQRLCSVNCVKWDSFLPSLLSSVSTVESSVGPDSPTLVGQNTMMSPSSSSAVPNNPTFQTNNPTSPLISMHGIGSPSQSMTDQSLVPTHPQAKHFDHSGSVHDNQSAKVNEIHSLRKLVCKIILASLEANLKPITHLAILSNMINWLVNWDQKQQCSEAVNATIIWKPQRQLNEWVHICLDVIWMLVDEDKCRIPFYELIHSALQSMDNIPNDEALFSIILKIHRRRDAVSTHMQMLDQHLHCPAFVTHRFLSQPYSNVTGEQVANLRYSPITYPSVLGEPLHGEELTLSIQKGSLDWERALRCLRHAIYSTPSPDWWRRVLVVAPCYRNNHTQFPGAVFSPEMICEAVIDRIMELLKMTSPDMPCWKDWLIFGDTFFSLMKTGGIDFVDFVHRLHSQINNGDQRILRTNHVTLILAQVIRMESITNLLKTDPKKIETTRKILSFHKEDMNRDANNVTPQSILLDFISSSQTLRIWSFDNSYREYLNGEQLQKGKQIDEWWKQTTKGERTIDFMKLDDRSMGMFWVLSFTMAQPACEAVMNWFTSTGLVDMPQAPNAQSNDRIMIMRETYPLSLPLLSGLSINLCLKLAYQLEEIIFLGQGIPSIAVVETYVRLLLISPHALFRPHFTTLNQRAPAIFNKANVLALLLEILNYRLLPLYRYHGKQKALMYDVSKIIFSIKLKRGEHRTFRLAENLCMNLMLSYRDFYMVKKDLKGPSELTETLNRITIISLAITMKTRGIAEVEHMLFLQPLLEQIISTSHHTWSEKTLRYFPPVIRDALTGRTNKRAQAIQAWQQAETTVIHQCNQLLSSQNDPNYVMTYLSHSFPLHRQYLCAGAWTLMNGHPESINSSNLGHVLREFSPEEMTANLYTLVDVLLHQIQMELQRGHNIQDILPRVIANLTFLIWTHELLPLDILLLALIDRDDDSCALRIVITLLDRRELQQRINLFCTNRISPEHWNNNQLPKRVEVQKALGNSLSLKERYPSFFDDIAARLIPVIPLIIYRLIENDATDIAGRVLALYSSILIFHPFRFTFVRDILAYFYGHLPSKLIVSILEVLDISKIPFSDSFPQHVSSSNPANCPSPDYFATLLLNIVNNVIPPLGGKSKSDSSCDISTNSVRPTQNKSPSVPQSNNVNNSSDSQKPFYQNQDPGTHTQLVLETAVIELLSLPVTSSQIVHSLVQIIAHIQTSLIQSSNGVGQNSGLPNSPSGASTEAYSATHANLATSGASFANFVAKSGYSCQQLSCLMIQACGLLLAHLPPDFHLQLYSEAARILKDCWWLNDNTRSVEELNSFVGYALLDPTWASQDNTSTAVGNIVALLHAFFSNLPHEWLESTHTVIKHLRPITSVAMMRVAFRILGPLLPRLAFARPLFMKTLALLFNVLADVFGKNSQQPAPIDASEITDIVDFLHHVVMYEGQGGPVQNTSRSRLDSLTLCGKVIELLRPDVAHLFSHLTIDPNTSVYASTHPKIVQNQT